MTRNRVFAPAKINLTLHVTGRRADGYHLLDSLVAFADIGDVLSVSPASQTRLTVTGPKAQGVPADGRNLVIRAAELMGITADIHLEKHLPAAAGIGGGSSDAAAVLRALAEMADAPLPSPAALVTLGADVPVCMVSQLSRMRGIGEVVDRLTPRAPLPMILVNPGVDVPTGAVFHALSSADNPAMDWPMPAMEGDWIDWLENQRNDLEPPALQVAPVIGSVLAALRDSAGCRLARMSGSGATCFAVMANAVSRDRAVADLRARNPGWWVQGCKAA
ncbi:4-(cytidine 5'-diphospho)-2-C-methyl-D-erythritol kinase [Arenibacterium sp. CAU 1754]